MSPVLWTDCVIDVSHQNGVINWARVDPSIILVFAKATQGAHFKDPQFDHNRAGCAETKRLFIPYHFITAEDADDQIDNFGQRLISGQPFMLDWEGRQGHTLLADDVEYMGQQLAADIDIRLPIGYWGITGSSPSAPTPAMQGWIKFTPRYPERGAGSFEAIPLMNRGIITSPFWQYTQWGRVAGIAGNVDRSVFHGTADDLRAAYAEWSKPVSGEGTKNAE